MKQFILLKTDKTICMIITIKKAGLKNAFEKKNDKD